jgi:asparagine synthase (glutamine-hydrolysing)
MCGIAGFLTQSVPDSGFETCLMGMTRTLAHRGPDSEGAWVDPAAGIALGHRRLAVVDLSPAGHQPMISASGRYAIVFNGEIYNFEELRQEIRTTSGDLTPAFRGHSDTEVMLACFDRLGVRKSLPRFNGMFAFAVWDRLDRKLHLARDPIGEKPLYYCSAGGSFLFGSELKALRAHPAFQGDIDRNALAMFLNHGYIPAPHSIYKKVFKLTPGSLLTVGGDQGVQIEPYWSFKDVVERGQSRPFRGSEDEAISRLEALLADAARIRMIADVPLGAFLSGGIDSSLVVAMMQSQSSKPVKTFTIGFHEGGYDEAVAAKAVARHLRTEHTEYYVTPKEAMDVVPRLPGLYDEPFADSSQIPTFLVAQLARRDVTVSLSGDGGDELFAGYTRYGRVLRTWRNLRFVPQGLRNSLIPGRGILQSDDGARRKLHKFAAIARTRDPLALYAAFNRLWHGAGPLVRDVPPFPSPRNEWPRCPDLLHQLMAVDTVSYLPDDILVKVDRACMGVSLESRIPLLDPRVVEFAWRLPRGMKMRGRETKWILRRILHKHVPRTLVERPKSGFGAPIAEWIRGPLRDWAEDLLDLRRIEVDGFFEAEPIRRRWKEHLSAQVDHSPVLWSVLMFQAWFRNETSQTACAQAATAIAAPEANALPRT